MPLIEQPDGMAIMGWIDGRGIQRMALAMWMKSDKKDVVPSSPRTCTVADAVVDGLAPELRDLESAQNGCVANARVTSRWSSTGWGRCRILSQHDQR